jgi:hypothetical protein
MYKKRNQTDYLKKVLVHQSLEEQSFSNSTAIAQVKSGVDRWGVEKCLGF